jgi:hypothetical protein
MLMDDALFPGNETDKVQGGVVRAIAEWIEQNKGWEKIDFWGGNTVLLRKIEEKIQMKKSKKAKVEGGNQG